jgi:hypothetical protein
MTYLVYQRNNFPKFKLFCIAPEIWKCIKLKEWQQFEKMKLLSNNTNIVNIKIYRID